jgi:ribosome-associated heat shock protein Hsp15
MRIDKLLWFLRLSHSRSAAQALIATGHVRLDGRRVERASAMVRVGSLLVLPGPETRAGAAAMPVRTIRLTRIPNRRGPASEAAACYLDLAQQAGLTTISDISG